MRQLTCIHARLRAAELVGYSEEISVTFGSVDDGFGWQRTMLVGLTHSEISVGVAQFNSS
jgi:hypothetical protein